MITCLHPRVIYNKWLGRPVTVPCGKCDGCRSLVANQWANRCMLEQNGHRFCYFGTLTYTDATYPRFDVRQLYGLGDSEYDLACEQSEDFLKFFNYNIRVIDYHDIQLFFKNLRNGIFRDYKERIPFCYFVACEYGPTTFHPHYHLLLYFDDPRLFRTLKERIYQAWFFANPAQTLSEFLRRNRWSIVRSSAASYVAGYLNMYGDVPPILKTELFRTKHTCSKSTPFGLSGVQQVSLETLQSGSPVSFSYQRPTTNRLVDVSLWRSIEGRYFPRCLGFSLLSPSERGSMYQLSIRYPEAKDFKSFVHRFLCEWLFFPPSSNDFRQLFATTKFTDPKNTFFETLRVPFDVSRLRRQYYISRRFCALSYEIGFDSYLSRLDNYYSRKDYYSLVSQLSFEEDLTNRYNGSQYLPFLPFIIDGLYYENKRHLPLRTRSLYDEQFHVENDYSTYAPVCSLPYREKASLFHRIASDNTKTKVKKDFLALHPEYSKFYKSILTHPLYES